MSIIQQHTSSSLSDAWRTINVDALDEEKTFNTATLLPNGGASLPEVSESEARALAGQVRQLVRGGDAEGALRGCLERPVYAVGGTTDAARDVHLQTVVEVLQSIKASEMSPLLVRMFQSDGGGELLDVLMKYLYKGMAQASAAGSSSGGGSAPRTPTRPNVGPTPSGGLGGFSQVGSRPGAANESTGAAMSVLLSWHEKVVEVAGLGCIGRVMTDWRRV